jgi:CubicO group peptidase (beta-lactamase class C family)
MYRPVGRITLLAATLGLATAPLCAQALPDGAAAALDRVFVRFDRTDGPGCAVGVVRAGALVHTRGFGIGTLDHDIPITPRSVFYLASVAKQFTAAAVLIAAEDGALTLDDSLHRWIPKFPEWGRRVTIRQMLHHTSGIPDFLLLMQRDGIPWENILTDEAMLALIASQADYDFPPGRETRYSNSNYVLLGEIIRRATGQSLAQFAEARIFAPLGMAQTHFHDDRTAVVPGRIFSYDPGPNGTWRTNYNMNFDRVGGGGLYSSIEDLARWEEAFLDDRLGVPEFAAQMTQRGVLRSGDSTDSALGLGVGSWRGLRRIAHGGGFMAFRTSRVWYPDEQLSVLVLCNDGSADAAALSREVEEIVLAGRLAVAPVPMSTDDSVAVLLAAVRQRQDRVAQGTELSGWTSCDGALSVFPRNAPPAPCPARAYPDSSQLGLLRVVAAHLELPLTLLVGPSARLDCMWLPEAPGRRRGLRLHLGIVSLQGDRALVHVTTGCETQRAGFGEGCAIHLRRVDGFWQPVADPHVGCFIT